ncbi:MAG: exodeoxyribonuclease I [Spirochaetota bacterium]
MSASLLWYDLETFGRHPQWDRIAQFGAIRTNGDFEEIGEPIVAYCRLTPDYVPDPESCLITGITPAEVQEKGMTEREFAALIHEEMMVPATCTAGFNTIAFDDEFIRALFYRNFYDPYRREYMNNNSRWDIIDLLRMCHDLRPEGMEWVRNEKGIPSFRLDALANANGVTLDNAHDALADVRATIGLARLVHQTKPKLFRYYYSLRRKDEVRRRLNLGEMKPILHTSAMYASESGSTTVVIPLSASPDNPNEIIVYDLRRDPTDWLDAPPEEIERRVFTPARELGENERIPLTGIRINRVPAVSPLGTIDEAQAESLGIDLGRCLRHAEIIRDRPDLLQRIRKIYGKRPPRNFSDPDLQIYSGDFFPDEDREEFDQIRAMPPEELKHNAPRLYDHRAPEMLWRYIARNHPEALTPEEQERWKSFCASRILTPEADGAWDIAAFKRKVGNLLSRVDTPARDKVILKSLQEYAEHLEATVLT